MAIVSSDGSGVLTRNQLVPSHGLVTEPPLASSPATGRSVILFSTILHSYYCKHFYPLLPLSGVYSLRRCVNESVMKEVLQRWRGCRFNATQRQQLAPDEPSPMPPLATDDSDERWRGNEFS